MQRVGRERCPLKAETRRRARLAPLRLSLLLLVVFVGYGMARAEVGGPPSPTIVGGKDFRLASSWGARETLAFRVIEPVPITLRATWTGSARLALILNGPGQVNCYARQDGSSPLTLTYRVRREDLRGGDQWVATIANFSRQGPIEGRLQVTYPARLSYSCTFLNDYPRNRDIGWSDDCQGLANSDTHWYIAQMTKLWKFPVSYDLNASTAGAVTANLAAALARAGYNHFGDPDFRSGYLFVPLEGRQPCKIVVFDGNLRMLASADLTEQTHAPWCAINPADGLLYTSGFDGVDALLGYRWELSAGSLRLSFERRLPLVDAGGRSLRINRVQGGAFSGLSGLCYLVADTGSGGGLYAFEAGTGKLVARTSIGYSPGFPNYQELEGLTVWDLEGAGAPGMRGQVHVVLIENDVASVDDVWIKHFQVPLEMR